VSLSRRDVQAVPADSRLPRATKSSFLFLCCHDHLDHEARPRARVHRPTLLPTPTPMTMESWSSARCMRMVKNRARGSYTSMNSSKATYSSATNTLASQLPNEHTDKMLQATARNADRGIGAARMEWNYSLRLSTTNSVTPSTTPTSSPCSVRRRRPICAMRRGENCEFVPLGGLPGDILTALLAALARDQDDIMADLRFLRAHGCPSPASPPALSPMQKSNTFNVP
jgi:hypothetical protein